LVSAVLSLEMSGQWSQDFCVTVTANRRSEKTCGSEVGSYAADGAHIKLSQPGVEDVSGILTDSTIVLNGNARTLVYRKR